MLGRLTGLPLQYLRIKRFKVAPIWATLDLTWNCNCRCSYCNYWRDDHEDLPADAMKLVIDRLGELGVVYLGLSGGEPLLRKDVVELTAHAKALGLFVGMNTNGTVGRLDVYDALMAAGIDTICFSIDGASAATHEMFRKNCPFHRVVDTIRKVVALRDEKGYGTRISTGTVIHRGNVHEVEEIARLRVTLGVDRNNFQPVWLGEVADEFRSEVGFGPADREVLEKAARTLAALPGSNLGAYSELLPDYYTDYDKVRSIECYGGRAFVYVDPRGVIHPCSIMLEPMGDLTRNDWRERLASDQTREILARAAGQQCPGCSLVCYMERNIMLNNVTRPALLRELVFRRYLPGLLRSGRSGERGR